MTLQTITDLGDPRLEPFRDMRRRNWIEQSGWFIAEGPLLVERLLKSQYRCASVLLDRKYERQYAPMIQGETDVYAVDHRLIQEIVGFQFHRGVIGCGLRDPLPPLQDSPDWTVDPSETIVATSGVQDPENLGCILRNCEALGIRRVVLGPETADPLGRRALRVSMGKTLNLQLYRSKNLARDFQWLSSKHSVKVYATSLAEDTVELTEVCRQGPALVVLGNERRGVPPDVLAAADHRIKIGMRDSEDSLNVCVAAGIILHYFCRLA